MDPVTVSAQFAAYTWFAERNGGQPTTAEEAARFARTNWPAFLPCAHEGLGRLLIRIAGRRRARRSRRRARRLMPAGTATE